jgi:hypothetical protein
MSDVDSPTADADGAPVFEIPDRDIIALEHPMVIQNLDNAVKTFGTNRPFLRVSSGPEFQPIIASSLHSISASRDTSSCEISLD